MHPFLWRGGRVACSSTLTSPPTPRPIPPRAARPSSWALSLTTQPAAPMAPLSGTSTSSSPYTAATPCHVMRGAPLLPQRGPTVGETVRWRGGSVGNRENKWRRRGPRRRPMRMSSSGSSERQRRLLGPLRTSGDGSGSLGRNGDGLADGASSF
jgi:hypothetical protein